MKKRIFSILLAALMLLTLAPTVALAAEPSNWEKLSAAMSFADPITATNVTIQGSSTDLFTVNDETDSGVTTRTITLLSSITADVGDVALAVPGGKTVVLDLNGYTISRELESSMVAGNVITVAGTLTVKDNSNPSHGKITGGKNTGAGGGIYVCGGGTFTLESGEISGNGAAVAGGVIIESGAEFVMTGGKISDNTVTAEGAGVFCQGSFTITGGEISGNTAGSIGGGVCCVAGSALTVGGSSKIADNTASSAANNVYLCTGASISISDTALTSPAAIGVTAQTVPTAAQASTITDTNATADDAAFFTSDNALYAVTFNTNHLELVENTDTWATLQSKINEATSAITIKLNKNITAGETDPALVIPAGKDITLDLNGFTLDRGLSEKPAQNKGNVIIVNGTLTVKDSSDPSTGKITGGNSSDFCGGGMIVYGTFTLESGEISENVSTQAGGGVLVMHEGVFTMNGGKIKGNCGDAGGAVFCHGSFTLNGGEIISNISTKHGAGVYVHGDDAYAGKTATKHFTMNGGSIKNNISGTEGGGVYVDNYDMDALLLSGEISGNNAAKDGGGVCCNAPITVGGNIKIKNNTSGADRRTITDNVYLCNKAKEQYNPIINISTPSDFKGTGQIGVTLESGEGTIVGYCTSSGVANFFFADSSLMKIVYDKSANILTVQQGSSVLSKVIKLLTVVVSTTVAVRTITGSAKLVVGAPMALAFAPQILRTLSRLVFFPKFF